MKRLLTLVVFVWCGQLAAKDLGALVIDLRYGSDSTRDSAKQELMKKGTVAVEALHAVYYPDVEALLKGLGADSFRVRKRSTSALIAIGAPCRDKVAALLKSTTDPEIAVRCKEILKKAKAMKGDGNINDAVEIVLTIGEKTTAAKPFVKHYFAAYKGLKENHKKLLSKAVDLCDDNELLKGVLPDLQTDDDLQLLAKVLTARLPKEGPRIIAKFEQLRLERDLDVTPYLNELSRRSRLDKNNYEALASKIEKQPLYDKTRLVLIRKLLKLDDDAAKALGIRLAKSDPKPFLKLIVAQVKELKQSGGPMILFLNDVKDRNKVFEPHLGMFLESPVEEIRTIGMEICASNPKKHKNVAINTFKTYCVNQDAAKFCNEFLRHFPYERKDLQDIVVNRLLDKNLNKEGDLINLASLLAELKYDRHALDEWYVRFHTGSRGEYNGWVVRVGVQVNVSGHVLMPLIRKGGFIREEVARHILNNTPKEHRNTVRDLFMAHAAEHGPGNAAVYTVLFKEAPDWFEAIVKASFASVTAYYCKHDWPQTFATRIVKDPSLAAYIRPYLSNESPTVRYYAATTLLEVNSRDEQAKATIIELAKSHLENAEFCESLLKLMDKFEFEFESMKAPLTAHYERLTDKKGSPSIIHLGFGPAFKDHLEFIRSQFKIHLKRGHKKVANSLALDILYAVPGDATALDYLTDVVKTGPAKIAAQTLSSLALFGKDPELSHKRLEQLYLTCETVDYMNWALDNSKKNRKKALPIVKQHLKRNLEEFSDLGSLLWGNEECQRALTPGLVHALKNSNLETQKRILHILTVGSCELKNHLPTLKKVYQQLGDTQSRQNFMWMLANMETDAAPFAPILKKDYDNSSGKDKSNFLFAMSRISPKRHDREGYTKLFLSHLKTVPAEDRPYRMLRLIKEFPEITFPVLHQVLREGKEPNRGEAVWGLINEKPFSSETIETFSIVLKRCQFPTESEDDVANSLCWALTDRVPDAIQFLPLLKKVRSTFKTERGYRFLTYAIRDYQRKERSKN